ncbi:transporter substrate-binding domain-containing protein [bacterium]|nr:transporter substrate-binding domain-containing protein [bacterium]
MLTDKYRSKHVGLFVRTGQIKKWNKISSIEDLNTSKINIAEVRGYSFGTQVDGILHEMGKDRVYLTIKASQNRLMLIARRFDGYLAYLPDESIVLNDNDLDHKIQLHPMKLIYTGGIHFLLSRKSTNQATLDTINKGLKTIMTNGKYDKILNKYTHLYGISQW